MVWNKKDSCETVEDVICRNTGLTVEDMLNPKNDTVIPYLDVVAEKIKEAIANKIPITIFGDYDCDGVTSSIILHTIIKHLGGKAMAILPKRFSDGYGLKMKIVDEINEGLLITIDNGITAIDEIQEAKNKGLSVIVLDHHIPLDDGRIPNADIVVDPHCSHPKFEDFCAAGIAYKLAELMIDDSCLLEELISYACIGTVADVMPLVHDNRYIVKKGLEIINSGRASKGINILLSLLGLFEITEHDIGFKLGPIINAVGRMHDGGANYAFAALYTANEELIHNMITINEERKTTVVENLALAESMIADNCMFGDCPLVLYTPKGEASFHEGIAGIIAGKIAEAYKVPTIVLTENENGIFKGSGRSYGSLHLKELLDSVSDTLIGYGGHAGAVGLSCEKAKITDFINAVQEAMDGIDDFSPESTNEIFYDIEIEAKDIPNYIDKVMSFAPYGEGNPQIIFKVTDNVLTPSNGKFHRFMGDKGQHAKLFGNKYDIVAFDGAELYEDLGFPKRVDVVGNLSINRFMDKTTTQVEATDIKKSTATKNKTTLSSCLADALKDL